MAERFDPYYKWLGIPPEEQPANHYRLLGVKVFEANPEVISHAADQRMAHLKSLQGGKNVAASQRLLNELSAAVVCLLDPEKKRAYDQALDQSLRSQQPQKPLNTVGQASSGTVESMPALSTARTRRRSRAKGPQLVIAGCIGLALAIAMIAIGLWWLNERGAQVAEKPATRPGLNAQPKPPGPPEPTPATPPSSNLPVPTTTAPPVAPASPQTPMPATPESPPPSPPAVAEVPASASSSPLPSETTNPPTEAPAAASPPVPNPEPRPPRSLADLVDQTDPAGVLPGANAATLSAPVDLPPAEALEKARAQVVEVLGEEAKQATKPEQKTALARKMLGLANETVGDAAAKYVLLDNARKMFIGAGDVRQATQTAGAMSAQFKLDADALNNSTFAALADANLAPEDRDQLAAKILEGLDAALEEQKFTIADDYSLLATKVSSRSKDAELRKSVAERRTEMQGLKTQLKSVEEARAALATDANDPAANLAVGKFLCFALGDWEQGAAHLLKSGNAAYVAAAEADARAGKGEKDAALPAADAWYKLSESLKKDDKDASTGALERAEERYAESLPSASGLERIRIEKRLAELQTGPEKSAPRLPRKRYYPGLVGREYPKHESQADGNLYTGWVPPEDLGTPVGPPALIGSLTPLKYSRDRNCIASGYLKIDTAGEYAFNANADYDRCALYINGDLICPFRDGETKVAKVALEKGMVPIQVVSMVVHSSQCLIKWQPPGASNLGPIPPTVVFHTRDLLEAPKEINFGKAAPPAAPSSRTRSEAKAPASSKASAAKAKTARPTLVIYNTHNFRYRDRGATLCTVRFLKNGKQVDAMRDVRLPWSPDQTPSVSLPVLATDFDAIRIEITAWKPSGGGLAEVQLIADGENRLAGKPATASAPYDPTNLTKCSPANLTDGVITAENGDMGEGVGYWLLPRPEAGWVEIKVAE